jgi:hypothetical protein
MQIKTLQKTVAHNLILTQEICHLYEKTQYRINQFNNLKRHLVRQMYKQNNTNLNSQRVINNEII